MNLQKKTPTAQIEWWESFPLPFGSEVLLECAGITLMQGDRGLSLPSDTKPRDALKSIHVKQISKQTPRQGIWNLGFGAQILTNCFKFAIYSHLVVFARVDKRGLSLVFNLGELYTCAQDCARLGLCVLCANAGGGLHLLGSNVSLNYWPSCSPWPSTVFN